MNIKDKHSIKFQMLPHGYLPKRGTIHSAGMDLVATQHCTIRGFAPFKMPLGFKIALPESHVGIISPRSGLGTKGLLLKNTAGFIDSDYRGQCFAPLIYRPNSIWGWIKYAFTGYKIKRGDRIAQLLVMPVLEANDHHCDLVEELDKTERGEGGFGSTGGRVSG